MKRLFRVSVPNKLSIEWMLISLAVLVDVIFPIAGRLYFISVLYSSCCLAGMLKAGVRISGMQLKLINAFLCFIVIQMLGSFRLQSMYAVHNVLTTFSMMLFVCFIIFVDGIIQLFYWRLTFGLVWLVMLCGYYGSYGCMGNTPSGVLLFFSLAYLCVEARARCTCTCLVFFCSLMLVVVVATSSARTALLSSGIVAFTYLMLTWYFRKKSTIYAMMFLGGLSVVYFIVLYMDMANFGWYETINYYSQLSFSKNLDSSRPELWKYSIKQMELWEFCIGQGTGKLPSITRYENSSFHNTYLQLLIQNGLVGLVLLGRIFFLFLVRIVDSIDRKEMKFVLACFTGIIIYDCFETTLLQNKVFLGQLQWLILGLGYRFCINDDSR